MSNTLVPIKTTTLTETTSSVTFSGIPQGYTDLKIVMSVRTNLDETPGVIYFNSDTTNTNYNVRRIIGEGSGSTSSSTANYPYMYYMNTSARTAGMFSTNEIYIHNYTSSSAKKMSSEGVTENNSTYVVLAEVFGTWSGTNPITSVTLKPYNEGGASFVAGSTFTLYGISNGVKATGGTLTVAGGYAYHTFTSTGSFLPTQKIKNAEVLIVAGGGGGGANMAGGGGAGGLVYASSLTLAAGTAYPCTVGAGGAGGTDNTIRGVTATSSSFGTYIALGGGGGGSLVPSSGLSGGSGGGGAGGYQGGTGGSGGAATQTSGINYIGYGNAGGSGASGSNGNFLAGGGGGGAGGAGADAVGLYTAGNGGVGLSTFSSWGATVQVGQNINGTYWFAGGGGGGVQPNQSYGAGGYGGGANGANSGSGAAPSGVANTGGGGGGGTTSTSINGGDGGSGIIIVRYPL